MDGWHQVFRTRAVFWPTNKMFTTMKISAINFVMITVAYIKVVRITSRYPTRIRRILFLPSHELCVSFPADPHSQIHLHSFLS